MHSLTAERLEVVRDLDHFAATEARAAARRKRHQARVQDLLSPNVAGRSQPPKPGLTRAAAARRARPRSWWTC